MQLSTPIAVNPSPIRINHQTPLMLIGSCFSDHIGLKLQQSGFDVLTNPFGTLYNPLSIALALNHSRFLMAHTARRTLALMDAPHPFLPPRPTNLSQPMQPDHPYCIPTTTKTPCRPYHLWNRFHLPSCYRFTPRAHRCQLSQASPTTLL